MTGNLTTRSITLAIVCTGLALGCVDKGKSQKKIDPAYVEKHLLSEAPAMENPVNADLGGKIVYLGNKVSTRILAPGGKAKITHYWKVVDPPGDQWRVFAHVNGQGGEWQNEDQTDMRLGHPVSKWQAGQIIEDEQEFGLKKDWRSRFAIVSVGLYRKGSNGVEGRMPIASGPKDKEQRVPAFRFKVDVGKTTKRGKQQYLVRRASGPIVIDGKADEDAWKNAPGSPDFSDAEGGTPLGHKTNARLLWDDEHLFAFIEVKDTDVYSEFSKRDDTLWKADVVELFIDADGNGRGYVELQVNPNNAIFDA